MNSSEIKTFNVNCRAGFISFDGAVDNRNEFDSN